VRALQAAPVLRPVGKAFGVQLRVGHCPNVLHRLRTVLRDAAAAQGAQSNDDTTAGEAAPPPRLIVSPPVPISQVGANALMVHSNAVTMLGVVGAVAQRQAQAVVCLHQCLTFGEQGEPPRFEFSFVVRVGMHYTVVACRSAGASYPACCRFGHARTGAGQQAIYDYSGPPGSKEPPQTQPQGRARRRVDECPESFEAAHGRCAGDSRE
jgi:hypothetical protein